MQNVHSSGWLLKGFLVAAVVSYGSIVAVAEPETKKESATATASAATVPFQGAVARVNGTAIDALEMRRAKKVLLRGETVPAEQQAALDKQAVEQLISAELLYQAAAKLELKDLDKQIDAKIAQGKARFKNEQEFKKAIKDLEMNEKDLREYTRRDLLISRFVETTFVSKAAVSEAESRAFYDNNLDKFKRTERKPADTADYKDVKTKIEEFLKGQKVNEAIQKYLADAKKTAKIEIFLK